MSQYRKPGGIVHKLLIGLRLRCPNCEEGHIAEGLLRIRPTCPVCGVRFERQPGESTGAMLLNISLMPILAILLFFLLWFTTDFPWWFSLGLIIGVLVLLMLLFHRHARGLWIAVAYLGGSVYRDDEAPQKP